MHSKVFIMAALQTKSCWGRQQCTKYCKMYSEDKIYMFFYTGGKNEQSQQSGFSLAETQNIK